MAYFFLFAILLVVTSQIDAETAVENEVKKVNQDQAKSEVSDFRQNFPFKFKHKEQKHVKKSKQQSKERAASFGSNDVNSLGGLRLIDENGYPSRKYGRVDVFMNGQWGTVCDDGADERTARVICRQINGMLHGYPRAFAYKGESFSYNRPFPIWIDDINCTGGERNIFECDSSARKHNCQHAEDLVVECGGVSSWIFDHTSSDYWRPSSTRISPGYTSDNYYSYQPQPAYSSDYYYSYEPAYSSDNYYSYEPAYSSDSYYSRDYDYSYRPEPSRATRYPYSTAAWHYDNYDESYTKDYRYPIYPSASYDYRPDQSSYYDYYNGKK